MNAEKEKYDIFISYRRDGGEDLATLLEERLVKLVQIPHVSGQLNIPPPQSTPNRNRCAPNPRRLCTATADIVHRKSTHKQTPAETFPPP